MATQADDIQQQPEPNDEPDPQPGEGEGGGEESNGEDSPYADLAKEMGWVPRDQFQGPAEEWKDPESFIRAGRDIQRDTARELKTVRQQLDTVARTSGAIVQQQVEERVAALVAGYAKAVDDGDQGKAFRLATEIDRLTTPATPGPPQPSNEAQSWVQKNSHWFQKPGYEYATARAIEICNTLAAQGYTDHATQLRIAEQRLRQEIPQVFGKNGKAPPGVHAPGGRGPVSSGRGKTFADMPPESQKIARDLEDRGLTTKEEFAKNYFANLAERA